MNYKNKLWKVKYLRVLAARPFCFELGPPRWKIKETRPNCVLSTSKWSCKKENEGTDEYD